MEIEYIRQLQSSYMRIALEGELERTEEEMLSHNKIPGLLAMNWQREDKKVLLRYDITGKVALDTLLEEKKANEELLERLFLGICNVIKELEKYLLSSEGILLNPEAIFCDHKTGEVSFCYYPSKQEALQERLQRFTEYLLTKTDHKNGDAVDLSYGMYEQLQKPVYHLKDMQDFLQERRLKKAPVYEVKEQAVTENIEEENRVYIPQKTKRTFTFKEWIRGFFQKAKQKEEVHQKEFLYEQGAQEVYDEGWENNATQLLSSEGREGPLGILKYEGTDFLPDIYMPQMPFLIGSAKDCDGIIKASGISRHHARIEYKEDTYFIEDMNSTNGTTVEGGILTYKTKVSIRKGNVICFANQPYRFL